MDSHSRHFGELFVAAAGSFGRPFWRPAVDAYQTVHGWLLKYELAGVAPQDVEVLLAGRTVTVRGMRRDLRVEGNQQSYCMEISYNRFERSLDLPCEVNTMDVATRFQDGMLFVQLTCKENPR